MIRCSQCGAEFSTRAAALDPAVHPCAKSYAEDGINISASLITVPDWLNATDGMGRTGAARDPQAAHALTLAPLGKQIADYVRALLPADTDFAVILVGKKGTVGQTEGGCDVLGNNVVAVTSSRERTVRPVARWVTQTLERMADPANDHADIVIGPRSEPWGKVPKVTP